MKFRVNKNYLLFLVFLPSFSFGQVTLDSTLLPIIKISSLGVTIPNEPKIKGEMGIIDNVNGLYNYVSDSANDYDGFIGIELRGSSSQFFFDKKNYGIETWSTFQQDTLVKLLGFPKSEDWILHGPYSDKSLMRNTLTFYLWDKTGRYGSRTKYVELIVNDDYKGLYMLMEKIKRDNKRVDVSKLTSDENTGDDLTGGYIIKLDKFEGSNSGSGWASPYSPPGNSEREIFFQYDYPKGDKITTQQKAYIEQYVTEFEDVLAGPNFRKLVTGYNAYIDVESFVDFAIINELTKNVDGYRLSTFLYKDKDSKGGKLTLGPIWDFNLAMGNANYCEGGNPTGWAWDFNTYCSDDNWLIPFWWKRLLQDRAFVSKLQTRWTELRADSYSNTSINNYIDSVANSLENPITRNYQRWNILGEWIWPNNFVGNTYQSEIDYMKSWLDERLAWLDENIDNLDIVTSFDSDLVESGILIYPNPVENELTIMNARQVVSIKMINSQGKELMIQSNNSENSFRLDTGSLPDGIYLLQLIRNDGSVLVKKVVK